MKLLGVFSPFWSTDGPHFVLPHFQGIFTSLGHEVKLLDLNLRLSRVLDDRWRHYMHNENGIWSDEKGVAAMLKNTGIVPLLTKAADDFSPDWVVFLAVNVTNFQVVRTLVNLMHTRRMVASYFRIGVGGPLCLHLAERETLFPEADFVAGGTLEAAVDTLTESEGQAIPMGYSLPRYAPDFTGLEMSDYAMPDRLPYILNYGCRFRCRFCHEGAQYEREVSRPTQGLGTELDAIVERYPQVKYVRFNDGSINSDHEQFLELLAELSEKNFWWGCNLSPSKLIDQTIAERMASAGCRFVNIGVESGSNRVRNLMAKPSSVETVEATMKALKRFGISISINLMVGYPGELEKDVDATIRFLDRAHDAIDDITVGATAVFYGTRLYDQRDELRIDLCADSAREFVFNHWKSSDGSNDPEIRRLRLSRVEKHLAGLGVRSSARASESHAY